MARVKCREPMICGVQWHFSIENCRASLIDAGVQVRDLPRLRPPSANRLSDEQEAVAASERRRQVVAARMEAARADMVAAGASQEDVERVMALPWFAAAHRNFVQRAGDPHRLEDSPVRGILPQQRNSAMGRALAARPNMPTEELGVWWSMAGAAEGDAVREAAEGPDSPVDSWAAVMIERAEGVPGAPREAFSHGMRDEARGVVAGFVARGGAENLDAVARDALGVEPPWEIGHHRPPFNGWDEPPKTQMQAYWRLMAGLEAHGVQPGPDAHGRKGAPYNPGLPPDNPAREAMFGSQDGLMQWGGLMGFDRYDQKGSSDSHASLNWMVHDLSRPDATDTRARMVVDWRLGSDRHLAMALAEWATDLSVIEQWGARIRRAADLHRDGAPREMAFAALGIRRGR